MPAIYTKFLNEVTTPFDFDYTFYDDSKKADFEDRFLRHFYYREIGQDTEERFKHYLRLKFEETLPYYNMLAETALINYERTVNYNLSDTFTRTVTRENVVEGTENVNGTTNNEQTNDLSIERSASNVDEIDKTLSSHNQNSVNKTSSTESSVDRNLDTVTEREDSSEEASSKDGSVSNTGANNLIKSDTPTGLLEMEDITNNVYATEAELTTNWNNGDTSEESSTSKNGLISETVGSSSNDESLTTSSDTLEDISDATNSEQSTITHTESASEANTGTVSTTGSANSNVTKNSEENGTEVETSERVMRGSYGVITEADMLKKHIDLQKTLTTIWVKFFDECEDLFMQVY